MMLRLCAAWRAWPADPPPVDLAALEGRCAASTPSSAIEKALAAQGSAAKRPQLEWLSATAAALVNEGGVLSLWRGLVPRVVRVVPGGGKVRAVALLLLFEAPALILYDRIPDGVGLAERLFRVHREILQAAVELLQRCACRSGCPSCVGPQASLAARSKSVALAILHGMLEERERMLTPIEEAAW